MANGPEEQKILTDAERRRDVILVAGKTGLGKSYLTKNSLIPEYNRVIIADPMQEYEKAMDFNVIDDLIDYCTEHKIFRVRDENISNFSDLCYVAYILGKCCFVIEESQRYLPARANMDTAFADLVFRGRHRAVSILLVMQRCSTVNINVRSQWTKIYTFRQTEKVDTNWLRDTSGFDLPRLETLEPGEYYYITPHDYELKGKKF